MGNITLGRTITLKTLKIFAADPSRTEAQYSPTANINVLTKVEINILIGIYPTI
jgi:hypothetical protein